MCSLCWVEIVPPYFYSFPRSDVDMDSSFAILYRFIADTTGYNVMILQQLQFPFYLSIYLSFVFIRKFSFLNFITKLHLIVGEIFTGSGNSLRVWTERSYLRKLSHVFKISKSCQQVRGVLPTCSVEIKIIIGIYLLGRKL